MEPDRRTQISNRASYESNDMNDPHVEALYYIVTHADDVDYHKALPCDIDKPGFKVHLANSRAEVTMKSHHATAETARAEVEPFLRVWELTAGLQLGLRQFEFIYDHSKIIDRSPTPGVHEAVGIARAHATATATAHVSRGRYPEPPSVDYARDAAVEFMFERFCRYRKGATTLADAGYFCLTILELKSGGRSGASRRYAVAKPVLVTLGKLTAEKGGIDARKADGVGADFTAGERHWIEETMKRLISRAAEIAGDPCASLPQITMAELPPLP